MNKANKMAEVARLLGVELNEEFKVSNFSGKYVITEKGFFQKVADNWACCIGNVINDLLNGSIKIEKPPYVPKYNEFYFSFSFQDFRVTSGRWTDWVEDYARLKCGAIFRTRAEAEEARPRVYEMLTGKKWEGKEVSQHE